MYDFIGGGDNVAPKYAGVRKGCALHRVLEALNVAVDCPEAFEKIDWDNLMERTRKEDGEVFLYGLSIGAINAGLALMHQLFRARTKGSVLNEFCNYSHEDVRVFLHRIAFSDEQIELILKHFDKHPDIVQDIFGCLVETSLMDMFAPPPEKPEAPKPARAEKDESAETPETPDEPAENGMEKPEFVSNEDIAAELAQSIDKHAADSKAEMLKRLTMHTAKTMTAQDYHMSEMDQHQQSTHFNSNLGSLLLFALYGFAYRLIELTWREDSDLLTFCLSIRSS